jgi:hypothetical protein
MVGAAIACQAVVNRFIKLLKLKFIIKNTKEKSQSPSGYCPLNTGGFINRTSCQTEAAFTTAY